jgi:chemotaxis protein MotA
VVAARLVFLPAALKMEQKEDVIRQRNMIVAEGLVGLSEKQSPRYLQDRLNSFLDPEVHFNIDRQLR